MNFLFETDFDEKLIEEEKEIEFKASNPLVYSEADLQRILSNEKEKSYHKGIEEGKELGRVAKEKELVSSAGDIIKQIQTVLETILEERSEFEKQLQKKGVEFFSTVMDKLLPEVISLTGDEKLKETIEKHYLSSLGSEWLKVETNSIIKDEINNKFISLLECENYKGKFEMGCDDNLSNNDVRVSWKSGKLEISLDDIVSDIVNIIKNSKSELQEKANE